MNGTLAGRWFWSDEATGGLSDVLCGEFVDDLTMGCYLARYEPHAELHEGVQELVHIERIIQEHWSIFDTREELMEAMGRDGDST